MNEIHETIKSDLLEISTAQRSLEKSLSILSIDLVKRFDDMIELQNTLDSLGVNESVSSNITSPIKREREETTLIERAPSRTRIAEELQRKALSKKPSSKRENEKRENPL